ncbi:MAG: hypothetical protein R6U13_14780 [Desulfatiglandaceae bacterium]
MPRKEIEAFKVKIDELLREGYNPILDNSVGKNIGIKGMSPTNLRKFREFYLAYREIQQAPPV